jgi:predicted alpha-1,2-mannosidase
MSTRIGHFGSAAVVISAVIVLAAVLWAAVQPAKFPMVATPDATAAPAAELDPIRYVDPFIGTAPSSSPSPDPVMYGGGGSTLPIVSTPFGMVQWGPDTPNAQPSGYTYTDSKIMGFSLTHFDGTGCPNNQDFPVLPVAGPVTQSPGAGNGAGWSSYSASFSHDGEIAAPDYYHVRLGTDSIQVDLTATTRTGFGRFTFPASAEATLLISPGYFTRGPQQATLNIVGDDQLTGSVTTGNFCKEGKWHQLYFAARFDRPFARFGTWNRDQLSPDSRSASGSEGATLGAYLTFDATRNPVVLIKIGLSFVSVANALENLDKENPGWDFDAVRSQTTAAWNALLGRIQVDGSSETDTRVFYTALYHALLHPNVFSDVNGQYIGFDQQVHRADLYTHYANFSGWDIYRCWVQLMALIAPERANDMLKSMVVDSQQGGSGLPKWSDANTETGIMVGDPGALIIANAYAFGAKGFDARTALSIMDRVASEPGARLQSIVIRPGLQHYLRYGYIPGIGGEVPAGTQGVWGAASTTLEYANADFAIAQFARLLGDEARYERLIRQSLNWRRLFDPARGYIRPRQADGTWVAGFDPAHDAGFAEGNAAQYTWMIAYDLPTLFDGLGGRVQAIQRLDWLFEELNAGVRRPHLYMGNEPQFGVPWTYNFAGAPWKTQQVVRRIMAGLFNATPGGLPGNDDMGAMSAWYVWAALGMYPAIPGTDVLVLATPLFPSIRIHLDNGNEIQITAPNAGMDNPYVRDLAVNGQPSSRAWLRFSDLLDGAHLQFSVGDRPDTTWGSDPADAPPWFVEGVEQ